MDQKGIAALKQDPRPDLIDFELRKTIKDRDRNKCRICGNRHKLEVHHIKPRNRGGTDDPKNLITLCKCCHKRIHGDIPFKAQKRYLEAWA